MVKFLTIRRKLDLDAASFLKNDPASTCIEEVYLAYPGFYAIAIYRFSHELFVLKTPVNICGINNILS